MKLRPVIAGVAVVGTLAAGGLFAGCGAPASASGPSKPAGGQRAPEALVSVVEPKRVEVAPKEVVTGHLGASRALMLGFEVGGRLSAIKVRKGEQVKAGQVLATLDTEVVEAQVRQAEAGVKAAEAQAALALDAATRQDELKKSGSVSELQSNASRLQADAASAQVQVARAALAQAKAGLRKHSLRAPFDATVIDAPEQIGGIVGPGMPLFMLEQLDPLLMKLTIAEPHRAAIKAGATVRVESVAGAAVTDDAVVRVVMPSADPQSRRIPVDILVPNPEGAFAANTLGRAILPLGEVTPADLLPATALVSVGGDHVFVVDGGKARRIPVEVIERGAREVAVRAREALTQVIAQPPSDLQEGTSVTVR